MKLLIIDHSAGSPSYGGDCRAFFLARQWEARGAQCVIVAADYCRSRRTNPERAGEPGSPDADGMIFLPTTPYESGLSGREKNLSEFSKRLSAASRALAERFSPEIVLLMMHAPGEYAGASRLAACCGARLVIELREGPETPEESGEGAISRTLTRLALRRAVSGAAAVVSVLPGAQGWLESIGAPPALFRCIPEAVPEPVPGRELSEHDADYFRRLRANHSFLVMYEGPVEEGRKLETLVRAAALPELRAAGVVLCGNGGYKVTLKRLVKELGVGNVYLADRVEPEERAALFAFADCAYFGRESVRGGRVPRELLECMELGLPVVAAVPEEACPVAAAKCGVCCPQAAAQTVAEAVGKLMAMSEPRRRAMGARGRAYIRERHGFPAAAEAYLSLFSGLGPDPPRS